jgi:protein translocase SecG subunit
MLFGILASVFVLLCFLTILLILLQKGKGSLGLGTMGGGTQMLFGGSGGQDLFQKATWVLLAFLMMGSLGLSIMKSRSGNHYVQRSAQAPL